MAGFLAAGLRSIKLFWGQSLLCFSLLIAIFFGLAPYLFEESARLKPGVESFSEAIATDVFRRSDPWADVQRNFKRGPVLEKERERVER